MQDNNLMMILIKFMRFCDYDEFSNQSTSKFVIFFYHLIRYQLYGCNSLMVSHTLSSKKHLNFLFYSTSKKKYHTSCPCRPLGVHTIGRAHVITYYLKRIRFSTLTSQLKILHLNLIMKLEITIRMICNCKHDKTTPNSIQIVCATGSAHKRAVTSNHLIST